MQYSTVIIFLIASVFAVILLYRSLVRLTQQHCLYIESMAENAERRINKLYPAVESFHTLTLAYIREQSFSTDYYDAAEKLFQLYISTHVEIRPSLVALINAHCRNEVINEFNKKVAAMNMSTASDIKCNDCSKRQK